MTYCGTAPSVCIYVVIYILLIYHCKTRLTNLAPTSIQAPENNHNSSNEKTKRRCKNQRYAQVQRLSSMGVNHAQIKWNKYKNKRDDQGWCSVASVIHTSMRFYPKCRVYCGWRPPSQAKDTNRTKQGITANRSIPAPWCCPRSPSWPRWER